LRDLKAVAASRVEECDAAPIIGGMLGLEVEDRGAPHPGFGGFAEFETPRAFYLANARSCIYAAVIALRPPTVWMPSYLCGAMVDAVRAGGCAERFFPLDSHLRIASWEWLNEVLPGDLVILIDYFGFGSSPEYAARIRRAGALILEDAAQAFFIDPMTSDADLIIYSPRKFLGVPDGGVLVLAGDTALSLPALAQPPSEWSLQTFIACLKRRDFDSYRVESDWFARSQAAESASPIGLYRMSDLSFALLQSGFDFPAIARKRRANYAFLAEVFRTSAVYPDLRDDVVPLGFPLRISKRDVVRQFLFTHHIYPPVHWPIDNVVPSSFVESHQLSRELLTLPCDQRYDQADMQRMVAAMNQALTL
jgi:hypothetical protein